MSRISKSVADCTAQTFQQFCTTTILICDLCHHTRGRMPLLPASMMTTSCYVAFLVKRTPKLNNRQSDRCKPCWAALRMQQKAARPHLLFTAPSYRPNSSSGMTRSVIQQRKRRSSITWRSVAMFCSNGWGRLSCRVIRRPNMHG